MASENLSASNNSVTVSDGVLLYNTQERYLWSFYTFTDSVINYYTNTQTYIHYHQIGSGTFRGHESPLDLNFSTVFAADYITYYTNTNNNYYTVRIYDAITKLYYSDIDTGVMFSYINDSLIDYGDNLVDLLQLETPPYKYNEQLSNTAQLYLPSVFPLYMNSANNYMPFTDTFSEKFNKRLDNKSFESIISINPDTSVLYSGGWYGDMVEFDKQRADMPLLRYNNQFCYVTPSMLNKYLTSISEMQSPESSMEVASKYANANIWEYNLGTTSAPYRVKKQASNLTDPTVRYSPNIPFLITEPLSGLETSHKNITCELYTPKIVVSYQDICTNSYYNSTNEDMLVVSYVTKTVINVYFWLNDVSSYIKIIEKYTDTAWYQTNYILDYTNGVFNYQYELPEELKYLPYSRVVYYVPMIASFKLFKGPSAQVDNKGINFQLINCLALNKFIVNTSQASFDSAVDFRGEGNLNDKAFIWSPFVIQNVPVKNADGSIIKNEDPDSLGYASLLNPSLHDITSSSAIDIDRGMFVSAWYQSESKHKFTNVKHIHNSKYDDQYKGNTISLSIVDIEDFTNYNQKYSSTENDIKVYTILKDVNTVNSLKIDVHNNDYYLSISIDNSIRLYKCVYNSSADSFTTTLEFEQKNAYNIDVCNLMNGIMR